MRTHHAPPSIRKSRAHPSVLIHDRLVEVVTAAIWAAYYSEHTAFAPCAAANGSHDIDDMSAPVHQTRGCVFVFPREGLRLQCFIHWDHQ